MVEDNGELHTMHIGRYCYNLRQGEWQEPRGNGRQWKLVVDETRSRGKFVLCLRTRCVANDQGKLRGQEDLREKLDERSCGGNTSGKEWLEVSPYKKEVGFVVREQEHAIAMHDGAESSTAGGSRNMNFACFCFLIVC